MSSRNQRGACKRVVKRRKTHFTLRKSCAKRKNFKENKNNVIGQSSSQTQHHVDGGVEEIVDLRKYLSGPQWGVGRETIDRTKSLSGPQWGVRREIIDLTNYLPEPRWGIHRKPRCGVRRKIVDLTKYLFGPHWEVRRHEIIDLTKYLSGPKWGVGREITDVTTMKRMSSCGLRANVHQISHLNEVNESSKFNTTFDMLFPREHAREEQGVEAVAKGSMGVAEEKNDGRNQLLDLIDKDQTSIQGELQGELAIHGATKALMEENKIVHAIDLMDDPTKKPNGKDEAPMKGGMEEGDEKVVAGKTSNVDDGDAMNQEIPTSRLLKIFNIDLNGFASADD